MLPHVIRFNAAEQNSRKSYNELAVIAELTSAGHNHAPETLVERIEMLLDLARMPRHVAGPDARRKLIPVLADEAARQWTATFNPRPLSKDDFIHLYEAAFKS